MERTWPVSAPAWEAGGGCSPPLSTPPGRGRARRGGGGTARCPAGARPVCTARAGLRSGWDCAPRRRALVGVSQRGERSGALGAGGECGRAAPRAARTPGQGHWLRFGGTRVWTSGSPSCPRPHVPGPASSLCPRWRAPAGLDGPSRPRCVAAPAGLPDLASLAQDVLLRQRQGAGGLSGAVRADCPQPCPVPFAEAGQLRWALCKVQAECPELRARQGAGSARPDCWERGLMARDIRGARSQAGSFIELLSPQARPPPPPGSPRECWPAEFGAKAEATRRAGWGLSGRPGVSTLLGSYRVGHAAPVHPPPPAPLPGSRAEGVGWRDPWGRGAARRRPEGKTSRAR